MAPDSRLFFNQVDMLARVRDAQCRLDPGNPGTNHQGRLLDSGMPGLDRGMPGNPVNGGRDQFFGFLSRQSGISLMDPGDMLADIGHLEKVGVQPGIGTGFSECRFMHKGGTRSYNYPVEKMLLNVLLDDRLSGVRAHIGVCAGKNYIWEFLGMRGDLLDVDDASDVCAALTHIDPYSA